MFTVHEYDFGLFDDASFDQGEPYKSNAGSGFINTGSDAAALWKRRHEAITTLARRRKQPRILVGGRR